MGFISKAIHQRTTDRLAAPIVVPTTLSADQVYELADQLVTNYVPHRGVAASLTNSDYHFRIAPSEGGGRSVFAHRSLTFDGSKVAKGSVWEARLAVSSTPPGSTVHLQLKRWKTKDGALVMKGAFISFRDELLRSLQPADPGSLS